MPNYRSRTTRTFACVATLAVVAAGCGAARTRPHPTAAGETPSAAPHTGTASDNHVDRDRSNQSYARIEEMIESRAPGVRVLHYQDGTIRLQIRGVSSPTGRTDPLIVIDGTPTTELRPGSALASLNPSDVVSIDVLKDAASTAFYGMRGANGVIVITTRQQ
jgi:iron complex outermembrane receptor protein